MNIITKSCQTFFRVLLETSLVTLPPFLRLPSLHLLLSPPPLDFISGVSSQRLSVSSEKERRFPSIQLSGEIRAD